jgi:hypothetical protein
VLRKLKEKAVRSYSQYCSSLPTPLTTNLANFPPSFGSPGQQRENIDDELAIFGGQTRVLSRRTRIKNSPTSTSTGMESSPSPPAVESLASPPNVAVAMHLDTTASIVGASTGTIDVHPSLMKYLDHDTFCGEELTFPPLYHQPSSSSSDHLNTQDAPPAKQTQMGDLYSSFIGYLAKRSLNNSTPTGPSMSISPSYGDQHHAPEQTGWARKPEEITGLPQADESFGWLPPSHRHPHPHEAVTMTMNRQYSSTSMGAEAGQFSQSPPAGPSSGAYPGPSQPQYSQAAYPPSQPYFVQEQYVRPQAAHVHEGAVPGGAMVELGLLTESEIDSGWLSFMQDCGIMESDQPASRGGLH